MELALWAPLALFCVLTTVALAQEPPIPRVLTVCEALHDLDSYRGKAAVIVGRSNGTFEGSFLHAKCGTDEHVLLQGHRWLSMIALAGAEKPTDINETFPIDEEILREKLSQLEEYQGPERTEAQGSIARKRVSVSSSGQWVAVYGTLDSPAKLRPHVPPSVSNSRNRPGNGYGANGSVPARIVVISSKIVP
jgi:hypothetical protein